MAVIQLGFASLNYFALFNKYREKYSSQKPKTTSYHEQIHLALPRGFVDGTWWFLVSAQGIFLKFHHCSICPQLFQPNFG
jgi:hypothetical protein